MTGLNAGNTDATRPDTPDEFETECPFCDATPSRLPDHLPTCPNR